MLLLPEAIQDWLPKGHLAHFISDTVDSLDLGAFHARYDKDGPRSQPFLPAMMVKVPVYGWATGGVQPAQDRLEAARRRRVEARVHGAEPEAHGGARLPLSSTRALVRLPGASLAEGGWRVRSNKLELPPGGGSGEPCVRAKG